MIESWKQVWEDIRSSLKSETKPTAPILQEDLEVNSSKDDEESNISPAEAESTGVSSPEVRSFVYNFTESGVSIQANDPAQIVLPQTKSVSRWRLLRENIIFLFAIAIILAVLWSLSRRGSFSEPQPPAPDVIATFKGGQITIADFEKHLALLTPDESQGIMNSLYKFELVVQDIVTDELAKQWAAERRPDNDETFSHTMEHITEEINLESFDSQLHENTAIVSESEIQTYYYKNREQFGDQTLDKVRDTIRQTLVAEREQGYTEKYIQSLKDNASITRNFELLDTPSPTNDDLRRYYDGNVAQFMLPKQVVVDQLEIPIGQDESAARQLATDALLSIRSGATFEQIAQGNTSISFTAASTITPDLQGVEWETAIVGLSDGEISNAFRAENFFYIVRLIKSENQRTQSFEEVSKIILPAVQQQQTDIWFESNKDKTLFTIKGRRYTVGQFYKEFQELSPLVQAQFVGSEGMRKLAEQLIERLLLVDDTYDQLSNSQNQPLTDEARLQVLKQMLHQENIDDQIEVTDDEMQAFYNANQDLMVRPAEARIRYIRVGLGTSEDEAKRARERANEAYNRLLPGALQTGEDFGSIAQQYSEDPETATNGGEFLGRIAEGSDLLAEAEAHPFHERVLTLQPNEISPVFEYGNSLYIVQVIERTESEKLSFEQTKSSIQEILYQQEHETLTTQLETTLLEKSDLTFYRSVLETYMNQSVTPDS